MQKERLVIKDFGESCTQEKQKLEEHMRENFSGVKNFNKDSGICYECLQKMTHGKTSLALR